VAVLTLSAPKGVLGNGSGFAHFYVRLVAIDFSVQATAPRVVCAIMWPASSWK